MLLFRVVFFSRTVPTSLFVNFYSFSSFSYFTQSDAEARVLQLLNLLRQQKARNAQLEAKVVSATEGLDAALAAERERATAEYVYCRGD